ncbi:drug resistance transporter, EmrB/QacA subfamily [Amycolatopsis xylanica]|uniref:Drug resistance transporter, EmrB/QacA subfamily n=1 Tax=Amycolatopsis xylanica TaxID=589385 RepID=A0A1H3R706_9PSEU|nr:DHA2 family efflux MFS transporter permease subunit [Amycolatopsis xylanica]SDZ20759.1 drug resistance transporter, EmrB/QacA subfamily [Amycolatopsis xylanica]
MLAVLFLSTFMALLDSSVVTVALPAIQRSLGGPLSNLQWVLDGYTVALATVMLTTGTLGDRFGRKRVFLAGLAVFTIASACCAFAPGIGWLIAARILQGAAGSVLIPGGLSLMAQAYPDPGRRARVLGVWGMVGALAFVAGPLVGGPLTDAFGWPSIFLINLPLGALALGFGLRSLRESADPEHASLDPLGQVLAIAWTGLLVYAVIEAGHSGWSATGVLVCLPGAMACLAAFVWVESRSVRPMLPLSLFSNGRFAAITVASFVLGAGSYGSFFLLSLYLQTVRGVSATGAGVRFLPLVLASSVFSLLAGRWGGRVLVLGYGLTGLALLACATITASTPYPVVAVLFAALGAGMGLALGPTNLAALAAVPRERSGVASATVNTARQTGTALGIAVLGAVVAAAGDFVGGLHISFVIAGTMTLAITVVLTLGPRRGTASGDRAVHEDGPRG